MSRLAKRSLAKRLNSSFVTLPSLSASKRLKKRFEAKVLGIDETVAVLVEAAELPVDAAEQAIEAEAAALLWLRAGLLAVLALLGILAAILPPAAHALARARRHVFEADAAVAVEVAHGEALPARLGELLLADAAVAVGIEASDEAGHPIVGAVLGRRLELGTIDDAVLVLVEVSEGRLAPGEELIERDDAVLVGIHLFEVLAEARRRGAEQASAALAEHGGAGAVAHMPAAQVGSGEGRNASRGKQDAGNQEDFLGHFLFSPGVARSLADNNDAAGPFRRPAGPGWHWISDD
jgi:hypothetical protein